MPGAVPERELRAEAQAWARGVAQAWEPGQVSGLARERVAASALAQEPDRAREAVPELAQAVVPAWASVRGLDQSQARAAAGGLEPVKVWEPVRERAAVQARELDPARKAVPEPVQAEALAWALGWVFGLDPGQAQA